MDSCHCAVKRVFILGHEEDRKDPQMLNSNIHAVCNTCGRTVTLVRCVQHRSTVYTTYLQNLQSRWRHSQVLVLKGFITPYETTLWKLCHLLWWWLLMYIMLDFGVVSVGILLSLICSLWSLQGRVFDFAVTDMLFLVVLMIILRRPSAAACARLVRWQLMHRWPGASAQFEHLWGQRIGILSMYDSRANGLMRLLGIEAAVSWMKFICMEWQWVKLDSTVSESTSILWAGKGRPSQDVRLWCTFCVSSMSLCVIGFACCDGSLFGLCVLSPHLCHQSSVL